MFIDPKLIIAITIGLLTFMYVSIDFIAWGFFNKNWHKNERYERIYLQIITTGRSLFIFLALPQVILYHSMNILYYPLIP